MSLRTNEMLYNRDEGTKIDEKQVMKNEKRIR